LRSAMEACDPREVSGCCPKASPKREFHNATSNITRSRHDRTKEGRIRADLDATWCWISLIGPDEFYVEILKAFDESKPLTDPTRVSDRLKLYVKGDERREFRRRWADTKSQRLERIITPLNQTIKIRYWRRAKSGRGHNMNVRMSIAALFSDVRPHALLAISLGHLFWNP
jgi:hypothetical protein